MEMSSAYLAQTVDHLKVAGGFAVEPSDEVKEREGVTIFKRRRYDCRKGDDQHLVLEVLTYPDAREAFYLEVVRIGAMSSFSFLLDSWKFRPKTVEFKYAIHPVTGTSLSFILALEAPPEPAASASPTG